MRPETATKRLGSAALAGAMLAAIAASSLSPAVETAQPATAGPPVVRHKTAGELAELAWLAGHWHGVDGETVSEEAWLAPAGGVMLGVHRDVTGQGGAFFEFLRVEQRDDEVVYVAQPMGRPATDFPATDIGRDTATFENSDHDFPRRLIYRREGDTLHVRAEGEQDGGELILTWRWTLRP